MLTEPIIIYFSLLAAIALGWLLGRYQGKRSARKEYPVAGPNIDFMLAENNDKALDRLLALSEIDDDSFDLYLNLGKSLRDKGLVDKSIQLHQGLFARTDLSDKKIQQVELELATDFMKAGLYDRAERLLIDLSENASKLRFKVIDLLIQLYEEEKEWQNILDLYQCYSSSFVSSTLLRRASHAACEVAEESIASHEILIAQKHIRLALKIDKSCARANVISARIARHQGEHQEAIRCYLKALKQDGNVMVAILDEMLESFNAVEDVKGLDIYLDQYWQQQHDINVLIARVRSKAKLGEQDAAAEILLSQLNHYPSTQGFFALVELAVAHKAELEKSQLFSVYDILRRIVNSEEKYVCKSCGFKLKEHHWRCPSCKDWASISHVMPSIKPRARI